MNQMQYFCLPLMIIITLFGCEEKESTVNNAPELYSVTITPMSEVYTSSLVHCEVTTSDPDNDMLRISIEWTDQDGLLLGQDKELQLSPSNTTPRNTITCTATVNDQEDTVQGSSSVTVDNQLPIVENIALVPSTVRIGDEIQCIPTVSDPDLESPSVTIAWQHNGNIVSSESTLLLAPDTQKEDLSNALPQQQIHMMIQMATESVEIQNSPPILNTLSICHSFQPHKILLNASPGYVDMDNDEVNFSIDDL